MLYRACKPVPLKVEIKEPSPPVEQVTATMQKKEGWPPLKIPVVSEHNYLSRPGVTPLQRTLHKARFEGEDIQGFNLFPIFEDAQQ